MTQKTILRKDILNKRLEYTQHNSASKKITKKLKKVLKPFNNFALYYPVKGEVNIWSLVEELSVAKNVYLPIASDKLYFAQYINQTKTRIGSMNILEPTTKVLDDINFLEAIVIPTIAISPNYARLGFGMGYYDRALVNYQGKKIAVVFDFQLTEIDFSEAHDLRFDIIITEKGVYNV